MAVDPLTVFLTATILGFFWYLLLSMGLILLVRLMDFERPTVSRMSLPYLIRYAIASLLAGLTAVYFFVRDSPRTEQDAWVSVGLALLIWTLILILWDLFAVRLGD